MQVVSTFAVGRVIRSKDSNYGEGDIVLSPYTPVAEYCVLPSQTLIRKIDADAGIPLPEYISTLGTYIIRFLSSNIILTFLLP